MLQRGGRQYARPSDNYHLFVLVQYIKFGLAAWCPCKSRALNPKHYNYEEDVLTTYPLFCLLGMGKNQYKVLR